MGGDYAPHSTVVGAVMAAEEYGHEIILVGPKSILETELAKHPRVSNRISIHHAPDVIGMNESPVLSVRRKRLSSINESIRLLKERQVDAVVSAGQTGAAVASATLQLGLLPGVDRAGIAIAMPTPRGITLIIDVGANIEPKALNLFQFGVMGDVYCRAVLNKPTPRVGLLNIGEEETKGTNAVQEAYKRLAASQLNFIGNVEGRDLFNGKCDCIICDGFVGNILLKVCESIVDTVVQLFKREVTKSPLTKIGALLCRPALLNIGKDTDYTEAGGAPLLGVDGNCIIAHGSSNHRAIKSALRVAAENVATKVNREIVKEISKYKDRDQAAIG